MLSPGAIIEQPRGHARWLRGGWSRRTGQCSAHRLLMPHAPRSQRPLSPTALASPDPLLPHQPPWARGGKRTGEPSLQSMRQTPHTQNPRSLLQHPCAPCSGKSHPGAAAPSISSLAAPRQPQPGDQEGGERDGRGIVAARRRPLGNGQTHVWVRGRPAVRQECAGSRIPAPSAAAGANWKQSISLVRPRRQGGARAPAGRPARPHPLLGAQPAPMGCPPGCCVGAAWGWHRAPWAVGTGARECPKPPRAGALLALAEDPATASSLPPENRAPLQPAWPGTRD